MDLIQKVEQFIVSKLSEELGNEFLYHNLTHTQRVVSFAKEIGEGEGLSKDELHILELAAWFHDVGYIQGEENHEKVGAQMAKDFLEKEKINPTIIEKVQQCILITDMKEKPSNLLEKSILDADCAHIGNKIYGETSELLREEWRLLKIKDVDDKEWLSGNIDFFTNCHNFHTNYARQNWQKTKDKNLSQLIKTAKKLEQEKNKSKLKAEEFKLKKHRAEIPERGIETMFRVTLKNHITLSDIADTKANILLSVNAIIISMALSNLIPKLDNPSNTYLIIPTVIFLVFSLVSMALSVLATRPNVTSGQFTREDVKQKKVNLLFFGNFHKVKLDEFEWAMGEMMKDREYLYSSMKKDLYFLGLVLHKKYKILRVTYTIFLTGIIVSVIAFAVAFKASGL